MKAEIISVGTELLLGHIVDTNANYLAQELTAAGIDLFYVSQVGDNLGRITETFRRAWERSDVIIITGGLGPTEDDLTREGIAALLGEQMVVQPDLERDLREFFARRNRPMPERNVKQATLIPSAQALPNPIGTAPGWWVERDGRIIIAMPGVPSEMHRMWQTEALPRLMGRSGAVLVTRILKVWGIGESSVEEMIQDLLASNNPTVATYAKADGIHVRVTAKAPDAESASALLAEPEARIREILGPAIYGVDSETLEGIVISLLRQRGHTLATMEALTGGLLSAALASAPGSAAVYRGGIVAPTPAQQVAWGVDPVMLEQHGAISVEAARQLATAARKKLMTDVGLALVGVGGPEAEQGQRPGTLHIAVDDRGKTVTESLIGFGNTRPQITARASLAALDFLRRYLLGQTPASQQQ